MCIFLMDKEQFYVICEQSIRFYTHIHAYVLYIYIYTEYMFIYVICDYS
jgi:hypothetical protein